ncbi:MAG: hypothetical protein AAFQ87_18795 [Bacteroidota bacterium]
MSRPFQVLLFICLGLGLSSFHATPFVQQAPLSLELVVPISAPNGEREISIERYYQLHVLIKNVSPHPQRVWKDWNTWGYFNLQLEWEAAGRTFPVRRKAPKVWDGDFPDYWTLNPGEVAILVVDLRSGDWEGFPDLYGESISASIKAVYENKQDVLAQEFNIWHGKLETKPLEVVFR